MLAKLQQVRDEGTLRPTHLYVGHLKKDEDQKLLAHADAWAWNEAEGCIRELVEQHLHQAIEGALGQANFPCSYTGEIVNVSKVATPEFDRTRNRPAVEVFEAIRDARDPAPKALIDLGNVLAYKVLTGSVKNNLLAILRFEMTPELNAPPITFVFATLCDLEDREEAFLDNNRGRFETQVLTNVLKRGSVSRAAFFPCLDDDGREQADLMVYAGSGAAGWFRALEVDQRFSPRREGQALVRLIAQQAGDGEVSHELFATMERELLTHAAHGLPSAAVADSLEKAVGHGIDREGFGARWASTFGDAGYRPSYEALFGSEEETGARLKMSAGDVQVTMRPAHLEGFRQVTVGDETYIIFKVPDRARVAVGKDLALTVKPVALADLIRWLEAE